MKAVSYARVSSVDQRDTGYSIPAQNQLFREYAQNKGLDIVQEFQESESAKGRGRKTFQLMINHVKKNGVKAIIFEKVDRMTRNFHDLITIYDLIEELDIEVHLIKNSLVLNKNSKSQEKFQLDIQVVLARNYVNNLSEEVKKGMAQKLMSGGWTHIAPLGYRNTRINGRAIVEPDPVTMPVMKQVFEMSHAGHSTNKIAAVVTELLGKKYHASKIYYLLTNTFYIGQMQSKYGKFSGTYETFIDPMLFYEVQDRLKGRNKAPDSKKRVFRFSGLLTCQCGAAMYGELKKGKYVTYGCSLRKTHDVRCTAVPRYVSERVVMELVSDILARVSISESDFQGIKAIIREMFKGIDEEACDNSDKLNTAIKAKKDRIIRLLDHYEDGILTKEEYLDQKETLQMQLIKLQAEYEAQTNTPIGYRTTFSNLFETFINVREYLPFVEDAADFQKVVRLIFSNLNFRAGKLEFSLTKLGQVMLDLQDHSGMVGPLGLEPRTNRL